MAHFAKIESSKVIDIVFVDNSITHVDVNDPSTEEEQRGVNYLKSIFGEDSDWVQCSFNTWKGDHKLSGNQIRYNMPEIGYTYNNVKDSFIPEKPGKDYILIERTQQWVNKASYSSNFDNSMDIWRNDF